MLVYLESRRFANSTGPSERELAWSGLFLVPLWVEVWPATGTHFNCGPGLDDELVLGALSCPSAR